MKGELDWIKVNVNSFDDNKIRIISSMPQGDSIICIWFRLLFEAGKNNDDGYVYINEVIPYTCEMLAKLFDRSTKKVQHALDVLRDFMMIEIDDDNFIKIKNWNKYQSVDKLEAIRESGKERTRRCRAKKKAEAEAAKLMEETKFKEDSSLQESSINNEAIVEAAVDYNYLQEEAYPEELQFKYDNGDCNVTCNAENVTVTDKIKNKKEIKNRDTEEEKEVEKKQDKNNNLKLSSNVTSNAQNCYSVTQSEMLQQRYAESTSNSDFINTQSISPNDNYNYNLDYIIKDNAIAYNNSPKNLDTIIEEILSKGDNNSSIEIAYAIQMFYGNASENKNWINVDEIRWMLIEHEWKYVKSAIEIAIAAKAFDCGYVNRILEKWKNDKYPECI